MFLLCLPMLMLSPGGPNESAGGANQRDLANEHLRPGEEPAPPEELTFGQKAVGLKFNHAQGDTHDAVHQAKQTFAGVIDQIGDPTASREPRSWMYSVLRTAAINATIAAQMAVVKFLTWKED